jgi:hypothetical protein
MRPVAQCRPVRRAEDRTCRMPSAHLSCNTAHSRKPGTQERARCEFFRAANRPLKPLDSANCSAFFVLLEISGQLT